MNGPMNRRSIALLAVVATLGVHPVQAFAAELDKGQLSVAEMAVYQGTDRQERLLAAAKKEGGELSVYHVYPNLPVVMTVFTNKYGIKVKAWRSGSEGVLQKLTSEARGSRFDADIVQNNAPENEAAHREKLLQEVRSPYLVDLIPEASPAHKEWVGITVDVYIAAYNTNKVKRTNYRRATRTCSIRNGRVASGSKSMTTAGSRRFRGRWEKGKPTSSLPTSSRPMAFRSAKGIRY